MRMSVLANRIERPGDVAQAETVVNTAHAEAVEDNRLKASDVAVVGFHGQMSV
jgi:1,6-anhydro-N-acetylmuramate kinase